MACWVFHLSSISTACGKGVVKKNFPNIGIYWPLASIRLQFYIRPRVEKCVFPKPSALFEQICSNFRSSFHRAFGSLQPPRLDHPNNPKQCFCKMSSNLFPTLTIYPIKSYHYRCGSCCHSGAKRVTQKHWNTQSKYVRHCESNACLTILCNNCNTLHVLLGNYNSHIFMANDQSLHQGLSTRWDLPSRHLGASNSKISMGKQSWSISIFLKGIRTPKLAYAYDLVDQQLTFWFCASVTAMGYQAPGQLQ